ncbi:hypothetical protein WJX73_008067 [Symbiochloris irregularis]|uniref:Phosphatidic acid phosphatase type 2/haloperoxidase domain-containing protein n=1 Tax=Symbiochloris irregularis TaxID=706552 RepID=A0AAW1PLG0_9CHLO
MARVMSDPVALDKHTPEPIPSQEPRLGKTASGITHLRMSAGHSRDLESQLTLPLGSWRLQDIDWGFVFKSQHYGTPLTTIAILIALLVVHWTLTPSKRVFFLYDASISYISHGDTIPAWVAVVVPLISLLISLVAYEFVIFRSFNLHITNAVATTVHFFVDCVCSFVTVEFITELTKMLIGRLRPNFLQECFGGQQQLEGVWRSSSPVQLGSSLVNDIDCPSPLSMASRKSFPSGHSSCSAVIMTYNIVFLLWAGYMRADGASFMGLRRQTGWRGGHRFLREIGHGFYLFWILVQAAFVWAVGVSRFADNKHQVSDVVGGWLLGTCFALIYSCRATSLHQYVVMHNVAARDRESQINGRFRAMPT